MVVVRIERSLGAPNDANDYELQPRGRRLSEDFIVQNRSARFCRNSFLHNQDVCSINQVENDCLSVHLPLIVNLLRPMDSLKSAVMLQSNQMSPIVVQSHYRYLCIICCHEIEHEHQDPCGELSSYKGMSEHALLGVDVIEHSRNEHLYCTDSNSTILEDKEESVTEANKPTGDSNDRCHQVTVGMFLPISMDLQLSLDGDGGFKVVSKQREFHFKPENVSSLWNVYQQINKAIVSASKHQTLSVFDIERNQWISFYNQLHLDASSQHRNRVLEWQRLCDLETHREDLLTTAVENPTERELTEMNIRKLLREIMYSLVDLDSVSVVELRVECEKRLNQSLTDFKQFISNEVVTIYGQMDEASKILDHLYLGSTYNASNLEELLEKNITHILNVTREVDNFFVDMDRFRYMNVRIYDVESSHLMARWSATHAFIKEAETNGTCCLVHCQRGISRSASTVIAYVMKEKQWNLEKAFNFVKSCRACIQPNPGFMQQLKTYEGILKANQRFIVHHHRRSGSTSDNFSTARSSYSSGYENEADDVAVSDGDEFKEFEKGRADSSASSIAATAARTRPPLLQNDSMGPEDDELYTTTQNDSSRIIFTVPAGIVSNIRHEWEQQLESSTNIGRTESLNRTKDRLATRNVAYNRVHSLTPRDPQPFISETNSFQQKTNVSIDDCDESH